MVVDPNIKVCPNILLATLSGNWARDELKGEDVDDDDGSGNDDRSDCITKTIAFTHSKIHSVNNFFCWKAIFLYVVLYL